MQRLLRNAESRQASELRVCVCVCVCVTAGWEHIRQRAVLSGRLGIQKPLWSERMNGLRAKTWRKSGRERVPPLQNSKKGHQKWAAATPTLRANSCELGRGGTRSRIVFLEVFARWPLILSDDNRYDIVYSVV